MGQGQDKVFPHPGQLGLGQDLSVLVGDGFFVALNAIAQPPRHRQRQHGDGPVGDDHRSNRLQARSPGKPAHYTAVDGDAVRGLPIPLRHLGKAFGNYRVTLASLAMNFVWTPLLAWGLGALFLRGAPDLRVGQLMLMVTPCTDWYLVFTGIAKGNVSLATALLPLNFVLQMVLLPVYLALFAQALVSLDLGVLVGKIATVLLIPLALALLSCYGMGWLKGPTWLHQKLPQVAIAQLLCLNLAIVAIFAAEGKALLQRLDLLLWLLLPIGSLFVINFVLAQWLGQRLRLAYPEVVA